MKRLEKEKVSVACFFFSHEYHYFTLHIGIKNESLYNQSLLVGEMMLEGFNILSVCV